jgi:hypothetical protein
MAFESKVQSDPRSPFDKASGYSGSGNKAQHTQAYVNLLKRFAKPLSSVGWGVETFFVKIIGSDQKPGPI